MKLIQLPTLDFEQKIQREIEENPALEQGQNSSDENNDEGQDDYSDSDDLNIDDVRAEIELSNKIFLKELGYVPNLFSYPFGEYSKLMRDYISKNFEFAFGQHSGVIDINKDKFELPRFPINEKYGELKRFSSIINYHPLI